MSNFSLEQAEQLGLDNKKEWHKKMLKGNREKAIKIIKRELPQGMKLKEYLDILDAEIQKTNDNRHL